MSSDSETASQQSSPLVDEGNRGFYIFLPFIAGIATADPPPSQDGDDRSLLPEGFVLLNPLTGSPLIMIQGSGNLDVPAKDGTLPASKASIEAMPAVKIEEEGSECAICLGEYEVGGEAKEMPCKHRYHSGCIEKWLGIHGSCPVCRYKMPAEEGDDKKKGGDGGNDGENRERRTGGEIRISFFFGGGVATESDRSSIQDTEIDNN